MSNVSYQATPSGSRRVLRSIGALVTGVIAIFVISMGTDAALHATGVYPPWFQPMAAHLWGLALAYRVVYGVLCAYLVARLAPDRPMWHAMVFGIIGLVFSLMGAVAIWNGGPEYGPKWFSVGLILIAIPCSWAGGRLAERRAAN